MPRVSDAEKLKSHNRILDAAAQMMRASGVEATSVADVMKTAGLTHGGFYRHFKNKDELAAAAFQHAVEGVLAEVEVASSEAERMTALDKYVATYLSMTHVKDQGNGCPLASVGVEAARNEGPLSTMASEAVWRMANILSPEDAKKPSDSIGQGLALMALLLGAITLARLVKDPERAAAILSAAQTGFNSIKEGWS